MTKEKDLYRDTWLRYLGYANEVGESVRHLVPSKVVAGSYVLATGYVCADTADKSYKEIKKGETVGNVAITATDVFIWQMLASVMIPGYTINRITYFSGLLLKKAKQPKNIVLYLPTLIGLSSIPFIVHPIDHACDYLMDNTYRKFIKKSS